MSNIKNLYILKPNVFSSNFAPLVLKDIENNYKIEQIAKIKFSQEEAIDFYKDSFFNHINKYGKKTAEQIRDKNASFMSSNDSLLLIISPKEKINIAKIHTSIRPASINPIMPPPKQKTPAESRA